MPLPSVQRPPRDFIVWTDLMGSLGGEVKNTHGGFDGSDQPKRVAATNTNLPFGQQEIGLIISKGRKVLSMKFWVVSHWAKTVATFTSKIVCWGDWTHKKQQHFQPTNMWGNRTTRKFESSSNFGQQWNHKWLVILWIWTSLGSQSLQATS